MEASTSRNDTRGAGAVRSGVPCDRNPSTGVACVARLRADFLYEGNRLWVARETLGTSIRFTRGGFDVEILFPATNGEFRDRQRRDDPRGAFAGGTSGRAGNPAQRRNLRILRVLMRRQDSVSAADFESGGRSQAAERAFGFLRAAQDLADRVVSELLDWVRIQGQPWLALHGQAPQLTDRQQLVDEDAGRPLPVGWPPSATLVQAAG